jgi:hypothetical protein
MKPKNPQQKIEFAKDTDDQVSFTFRDLDLSEQIKEANINFNNWKYGKMPKKAGRVRVQRNQDSK